MPTRQTGAARFFTEQELGGPTRENETNVTVLTTVTKVVQANPDRVGLVMVNQGANSVNVSLSNSVSTSIGIALTANGGSVTMTVRDDYTVLTREWDGIANGGSSAVYVLEIISDVILAPEQA